MADAGCVDAPAPDLLPRRDLLGICAASGLECLDLQPVLDAEPGPLFLDGVHPSAHGYRVIARGIADRLSVP